LSSNKTKNGKP